MPLQTCNVVGLDDETLIGGPPQMLQGQLSDLRRSDAIIVDSFSIRDKLARVLPDGRHVPLKIGDTMELNDRQGHAGRKACTLKNWRHDGTE